MSGRCLRWPALALGLGLLWATVACDPEPTSPTSNQESVDTQKAVLSAKEMLGKKLFFDTDLSTPKGVACAACHGPAVGFTGPDALINATTVVYPGAVHTRFGNRKPPSSAYAFHSPEFHYDAATGMYVGGEFWDGRAKDLVAQAKGPFLNPLEQNNPSAKQVVLKVRHSDYADLFLQVFGPDAFDDVAVAYDYIAQAIAAYESSGEVNPYTSKYDYYLAGKVSLSAAEQRGLELFEGKAKCSGCHQSRFDNGTPPDFTDFTYDNLGVPKNPDNPFYTMPPSINPAGPAYVDLGLGAIVGEADQNGKFKVPTLRNVDKRPYAGFTKAYSHNGFFKSLESIVQFYNTRDVPGLWPPPEVSENLNTTELGNLGLTAAEVQDIVAFLKTLTDGYPAP